MWKIMFCPYAVGVALVTVARILFTSDHHRPYTNKTGLAYRVAVVKTGQT